MTLFIYRSQVKTQTAVRGKILIHCCRGQTPGKNSLSRHGDTAARGAGFSVQLAQNYNKNIVGVAGLIAEFLPGPNLHECKAVGVIIQHNCGPAPSYCWSSHNEMVELVLN